MISLQQKEVLQAYLAGLRETLRETLDAVILYGSCARGESNEDSDIDVLCIMRDPFSYGEMISRTSALTAQLSLE